MTSYYSVIQYVPDPLADERLNIGVLVFEQGLLRCRFVRNWQRIRLFGDQDISLLRDFASEIERRAADQGTLLGDSSRPSEDSIRALATGWINAIQFTVPRASLLPAEELLADLGQRLLRDRARHPHGFRGRRTAAKYAAEHIWQAFEAEGSALVRRNQKVSGQVDEHIFDVTAANGALLLAAQGLSFEGPVSRQQEREVESAAWAVDDIRKSTPDLSLAVVALPPRKGASKTYGRAQHVLRELGAEFVPEPEAADWARDRASAVRKPSPPTLPLPS